MVDKICRFLVAVVICVNEIKCRATVAHVIFLSGRRGRGIVATTAIIWQFSNAFKWCFWQFYNLKKYNLRQ